MSRRTDALAVAHVRQAVQAALELGARREPARHPKPRGLSTGLEALDRSLDGLQPGALYVVGGASGMGKTSLLLGITLALTARGTGVLYVSANETGAALASVALAQLAGARTKAAAELARRPLWFCDAWPASVPELEQVVAKVARRKPLGLVVLEPFDAVVDAGRDAWDRERTAALALRRLAQRRQLALVTTVALQPGWRAFEDRRPVLVDLRGQGMLARIADVVLLLHRDAYYAADQAGPKHVAEIIVAKNRLGPGHGTRYVEYDASRKRFGDLEPAAR